MILLNNNNSEQYYCFNYVFTILLQIATTARRCIVITYVNIIIDCALCEENLKLHIVLHFQIVSNF